MIRRFTLCLLLTLTLVGPAAIRRVEAQMMPKAQVANLISKVENGVDEFRKYLERKGENAQNTASTAQAQGGSQNVRHQRARKPMPTPRRTSWTVRSTT